MGITIIIALMGLTALSHTSPFPFVLDAFSGSVTLWRMPASANEKVIYLTFDDGPNPSVTPLLLDLLKEKKVRVTFFLIDHHVHEGTIPMVRRMFDEGHAVALHSGNRWLMMKSPGRLAETLQATADRWERLTGHRPCPLFRPHAGWRSLPMMRGVANAQFKLVGWSWMSWDWVWFRQRTGERVAKQILSHAAPGKIIVIHDGHHVNPQADRQYAVEATARIIDGLTLRGFRFAPLCDPTYPVVQEIGEGCEGLP